MRYTKNPPPSQTNHPAHSGGRPGGLHRVQHHHLHRLLLLLLLVAAGALLALPGCGQKTETTYPHLVTIESIEGTPDQGYDYLLRFHHSQTGEAAPPPTREGALEGVADQTVLGPLSGPIPVTHTDITIGFYSPEELPGWALHTFTKGAQTLVETLIHQDASVLLNLPQPGTTPPPPTRRRTITLSPERAAQVLADRAEGYQQLPEEGAENRQLNRKPAIMEGETLRELLNKIVTGSRTPDHPRRFKCLVMLTDGIASGPFWREAATMAATMGVHLHLLPVTGPGTPAQPKLEPRNAVYPASSTLYQLTGTTEAMVKIMGTLYAGGLSPAQTGGAPLLLQKPGALVRLPGDGWELFRAPSMENPGLFLHMDTPRRLSGSWSKGHQCQAPMLVLSPDKNPLYPAASHFRLTDGDGRIHPLTVSAPGTGTGDSPHNKNIMMVAQNPGPPEQAEAIRDGVGAFIATLNMADRIAFYGETPSSSPGPDPAHGTTGGQEEPPLFQTTVAQWAKPTAAFPLLRLGNTTLLQQALHGARRLAEATGHLTDDQKVLMVFSGPTQLNAAANSRNRRQVINQIRDLGVKMIWIAYDPWDDKATFQKELEVSGSILLVAHKKEEMKKLAEKTGEIFRGHRMVTFQCPTPRVPGGNHLTLQMEYGGSTATTTLTVE